MSGSNYNFNLLIMKMYRKINISLILLFIVFIGCDEGLDILPTDSVSEETYWDRERDAIVALNGVYREIDGVQMVKELDAITDIGYRGSSGPGTFHDVGAGNIDPSNNAIGSQWNRYYRGVRRANDLIVNIDRIEDGDPALLSRLKSEARFLRAYFYTQLSSLWGAVPLITEPLGINEHVGRTDKEQVVNFVIEELEDLINTNALPISYEGVSQGNIGRATHGAALALKARVSIRNHKFELARDASLAVMDLGVYSLFPDYEGLFQYAGQNSEEVIFDRQYETGGQTYNGFGMGPGSIGGSSTPEPIRQLKLYHEYTGPRNPDNPYENIDPRWDYNVYYTGQPLGNTIFNSWPDSPTNDRVGLQETSTEHGYNLKKWIDYDADSGSPSSSTINMILIRYADVLLMYAEAKIQLNEIDQSVFDAINEVRQRPTVDMPPIIASGQSQEELMEIIMNERAVEFAFEGLRLFDMNRWGIGERKAGLVQGMNYIDQDNGEWKIWDRNFVRSFNPERDILWPIPYTEMEINDAITNNNPGY
jgi:starch-binding outer membrane protein, SusD/RagB family